MQSETSMCVNLHVTTHTWRRLDGIFCGLQF